ncbi:protein kinase domain-containing protein [Desulfobacter latus]|uniref:non-specific serine/threonine protein kinase n=1 Tax=Desulfobacter latus TaxID=2292 RepID=A0A850T3U3_9BACT|nr:hypothetical protein [Desulfobacter latus]NWH03882.1 hypothetical protein [Desulfobacter latus]
MEVFKGNNHTRIRNFTHKGKTYTFPAVLAKRYELKKILFSGGHGLILEAYDKKIFNRRVLVKAPLIPDSALRFPNDRQLVTAVANAREGAKMERKMFMHAQLRGVSDVPMLIDWVDDVNPTIYGPHKAENGQEFTVTDADLWDNFSYLIIGYVNGKPLSEAFAQQKRIKGNLLGSLTSLTYYLANTLKRFHKPENFGGNELHFIYQDLKPDNLLYTDDKRFVLIDLGSFAIVHPGGVAHGGVVTDGYTPPEFDHARTNNKDMFTPQFDVYSFGKTLSVCIQHATDVAVPSPDKEIASLNINDKWKTLIQKCTEDRLNKRLSDFNKVLSAL